MKIKLLVLLPLLSMLFAASATVHAQDKLPPQLAYIDAQLEIFVPAVQNYQADYFKANKRYYQALGSHSTAPSDAQAASDLTSHPTDQLTSLAPLWDYTGLPASIAWSFTVNTEVTPDGPGFSIVIQTVIDKNTWQRVYDFTPGNKNIPWEILPQ
jgi:hypothetical protein